MLVCTSSCISSGYCCDWLTCLADRSSVHLIEDEVSHHTNGYLPPMSPVPPMLELEYHVDAMMYHNTSHFVLHVFNNDGLKFLVAAMQEYAAASHDKSFNVTLDTLTKWVKEYQDAL